MWCLQHSRTTLQRRAGKCTERADRAQPDGRAGNVNTGPCWGAEGKGAPGDTWWVAHGQEEVGNGVHQNPAHHQYLASREERAERRGRRGQGRNKCQEYPPFPPQDIWNNIKLAKSCCPHFTVLWPVGKSYPLTEAIPSQRPHCLISIEGTETLNPQVIWRVDSLTDGHWAEFLAHGCCLIKSGWTTWDCCFCRSKNDWLWVVSYGSNHSPW